MKVILSTPMLLECGDFSMKEISLKMAIKWVRMFAPTNFVGHSTVKLLGIEPATSRDQCLGYTQALVIKPMGRLDFGREYSIKEIQEMGVSCYIINKKLPEGGV